MALPEQKSISRYVTFKLADDMAGIDILDIREIVPCLRLTPVAQAPEFVVGLINLRGRILLVIDIGVLLGQRKRAAGPKSHIIIFKHRDIGFIVDRVGDVISTDKALKDTIPANIEPGVKKYMAHIINLPEDILMVFDAKKILSRILPVPQTAEDIV